ncbi:probable protein phosphatase 2C 25 [Lycium barbarum]|uniref:probable protein phosphatase 2C 25 n=1 Tax=Lycium barbarum TaxID=112863 RepID=UPI00293E0E94|nr:probable protein phosphatase 2C 25 [Lycium barbarum]
MCTVAISNSPAFSPAPRVPVRSSSFSSSSCKSSETLTLTRFPSFSSSSSSSPSSKTTITAYPVPLAPSSSSSSPSSQLKVLPISLIRNSTHCSTSAPSSSSSSTTVLKRKRPARLDIPVVVSKTLENFRVNQVVMVDDVEDEGEGYYVCCKRGRRGAMEDRYSALVNSQGHSKQGMFGIFDGHGGAKAAEFAAEHLNKNIMDELVKRNDEDIAESVKMGYLKTDSEFLSQDFRGGSCCVTALIRNSNLAVSNAGDCRAVVSRGGIAEALTTDHKPSRKDEKDRIETSGGYVDCSNGVWRIQGSLAVSRGVGDRYLKQWIIAEPETKVLELNPELEFLVLASDGLWDKVSNQEVVDAARPLCTGINNPQPLLASKKLIDLAASRGSVDDISVMIIQLQQFC